MVFKRTLTFIFCMFLLILLLAQPNLASQKKRKVSARNAEVPYTTAPLDMSTSKLPPNFRGHDIVLLYHQLETKAFSKGEYESTEQYLARINAAKTTQLHAFKLESTDALTFRYDADEQAMKIEIPTFSLSNPELSYKATRIKVKGGRSDLSYYQGSNSFGVKKTITKIVAEDYNIALEKKLKSTDFLLDRIGIMLGMKSDDARARKSYLAILLICRLTTSSPVPRLIYTDVTFISPTISNPTDYFATHKNINVELREIWIYDTHTGDILSKQTPDQLNATADEQEERRRQIWQEYVEAENRAARDAARTYSYTNPETMGKYYDLKNQLQENYRNEIALKYKMTRQELSRIELEGQSKDWRFKK